VRAWRGRILLGSLVPLAACAWLLAHRGLPFEFLVGQDELEYADLARAIARGEGFTSGLIYPVELAQGVGPERPNLLRPPAWPLALASVYALFGASEAAAHGLLLVLYCAAVLVSGLLAASVAGPGIGFAAGLAVALCPPIQVLALLATTELLCAVCVLAVFLLLARGAAPAWVGAACGAVYLTRYNAGVVLPVALLACALRRRRWQDAALCAAGFAAVALPWWLRNLALTGNPFFSYYAWVSQMPIGLRGDYTRSLMHYLDPSEAVASLPSAAEKAIELLPALLRRSPFLSANLVACLGLAVAALRRQRLALYTLLGAVLWTVAIAFALPRGRYFAPYFPVVIALGAAGWRQLGPRSGALGAAGAVLASLLPPLVPPANDLAVLQVEMRRPRAPEPPPAWQRCISDRSLVFGEDASEIAWRTDATTIWLTATESDFWQVLERFPIDFVYLGTRRDLRTPRFLERFEPAPDCGAHFYRRRAGPGEPHQLLGSPSAPRR
jgi:4-amino-4-deoxy-L-arabinose transferase-like glycosyltransferase